ncbi:hypothetical protein V2J09_002650 [Rumex salicifolius]
MSGLMRCRDSTNRTGDSPEVGGGGHLSSPLSSASASVLPQRIEFHLSRKSSSLSFSGSNIKPQNSSSEPSGALHSAFENDINFDFDFHMPVRRIGAGLENLGNTCFLNSVLQCLTYTEPLVAYLQRGKHLNSCRVVGFCALCAMQKHVTRTLLATGKVLAPKEIVSNLRQEDAHEYMVHLLESMHKCCLPLGVPSESSGAYEKSFVHKIFGGCLRSQVKCMQCSYSSNKSDPFIDLSLEIVKADSLQKALVHFTAQEQLDGGERRYQCQQCKKKVQALKQLTIEKAPYVLTIHLKRFGPHISGQKIDKKVQFGPTLNLKPFVSDSYDGDLNYKLYGVLVHAGWSTHSGHYYCFVRASSGMWYSLDDNRVVQVSEKTVMQQKAYMLFYVRDGKASASKHIVNTVHSTQYGSCPISATSQISENRSTDRPANGSLATQLVSKGFPKGQGEKDIEGRFQENIAAKKCNGVGASDDIIKNSILNGQVANISLSKEVYVGKCNRKDLPQSSFEGSDVACLKRNDGGNPSNTIEEAAILHPSKITTSEDKVSKVGIGFEEPVRKRKAGIKSGNAFSMSSRQKLKKNVLTYRVASAHLRLKMLYLASINMQKRKKHKKVKRENQIVAAMNIVDEPIIMEPSTSHLAIATVAHGSRASRKGSKRGVRKTDADDAKSDVTSSGVSVRENYDLELEKRIDSGDAVPSGDNQPLGILETHATLKNQSERQPSGLNGKVNVGNGISVARWDDIESEPSQTFGTDNTNNVSIGYVPDEWDEEYDRGKRKKVRTTKIDFGGPNPFQEVATKAAAKSNDRSKHHNIVNQTLNL